MGDSHPEQTGPRARAIGDLPLDALLPRAEELTRRWAIALILVRPMDHLGSLELDRLAAEGPVISRALILALSSDAELAALVGDRSEQSGGPAVPARVLALAESTEPGALVEVVESLRGAVWELLVDTMGGPMAASGARTLLEAGDRLAYACSRLLAVVLSSRPGAFEEGSEQIAELPLSDHPLLHAPAGGGIAIFDDRAPPSDRAEAVELSREPPSQAPSPRAGPLAERLRVSGSGVAEIEEADIEIRDERREEGPGAWISSIGRQLVQFAQDRRPFAVLLVEMLDVDQHGQARDPDALESFLARLERLLADELASSSGGWLTRERPGRCWLLSPETDRLGAMRLAERLRIAASASGARLGGSATVIVGAAVCPDDGERAPALAAHADIGLYAARAEARAAAAASRAAPRERGGQ
jgi:GGDEF domain-containing protein